MTLRARVALHAGQRPPEPTSDWTPGRRAAAWERGMAAATEGPVEDRPETTEEPKPPASRGAAVELSEGTAGSRTPEAAIVAPDVSRVRGEAYAHGLYRLFVRGRAVGGQPAPGGVPAGATAPRGGDSAGSRGSGAVESWPGGAAGPATPRGSGAAGPAGLWARGAVVPAMLRATEVVNTPVVRATEVVNPPVVRATEVVNPPVVRVTDEVAPPVLRRDGSSTPPVAVCPDSAGDLALGVDRGGFVRRVVDWPLTPGERPALLGGALARLGLPDAGRLRALVPRLLAGGSPGASGSQAVFLDVETTALDRGAGALAFMVGLAAHVDGALRVEQWILTRLSAEPAMLAEVLARVGALAGPGTVLASFNGASFDVPLLRTRLRRAGLQPTALERPHLDLLPVARRMWRGRGPDCRLVTLERTQLGVRRVHDIAGHEIPAVFWAWLRAPGDPEVRAVMGRVADHNLADLVTLPALGAALGACLEAPADLDMAVRAAEHCLAAGRRGEALALLDAWQSRAAAPAQRRRALLLAADLLRRDSASRGRAAELWTEVCRICPGDPAAHEALAKHLEHHVGDPARALEVASGSAAPCPRRVDRLRRKLASPRSVPGPLRPGRLSC